MINSTPHCSLLVTLLLGTEHAVCIGLSLRVSQHVACIHCLVLLYTAFYLSPYLQALSTLSARYAALGKRLKLRALKQDSLRAMLKQSDLLHADMIDETHAPLLAALQQRGGGGEPQKVSSTRI